MSFLKKIVITLYLIIFSFIGYAYEKYVDFDLIKEAGKPRFVEDGILLTLLGGENKIAYIRTNLDNWEKNYYYKTSLYNVLYVFIRYSNFNNRKTNTFLYRINVNGFWIPDPYNEEFVYDSFGSKLYSINISEQKEYDRELPVIEFTKNNIKEVVFRYYNPDAQEVNFVCSIDNWAQYSHPMKKDIDGYWSIKKYFTKGIYFYYFFVDGKKYIDLENMKKIWDERKGQVSYFSIK